MSADIVQELNDESRACINLADGAQNAIVNERENRLAMQFSRAAAEIVRLRGEMDKGAAFKSYVHMRLDEAGIPIDPPSPHRDAGCRIGGRLDVALSSIAPAEAKGDEPVFHLRSYGDVTADELKRYTNPQPADGGAVAPFVWFATDDDGRYGIGADREGSVRDLGGLPEAVSRVFPLYTHPPAAQVQQEAVRAAADLARSLLEAGMLTHNGTSRITVHATRAKAVLTRLTEALAMKAPNPSACEVRVDEAMVERYCVAFFGSAWPSASKHNDNGIRALVRDALTAALQHRGDSQEVSRG